NILFGGDPATATPADIEIRRNHLFKPLTWLKGQSGYVGVQFIVKNHFELKNAQRVLFEGNVLDTTWGGFSQNGWSLLLTPKNSLGQCSGCKVTDVTARYNYITHVGSGIAVANALSDSGQPPAGGGRYSIHDNVVDDVNPTMYSGTGVWMQISM